MITVVTPTIPGRERQLAECHASVAALNLRHLIAVDQNHEGPAAVRNELLADVHTEWVLFLDDDDLLFPNYVDTVTPHLADADVVYTAWQLSGAVDPVPYPRFDPELLRDHNIIPVTACVRTEALRAVGGFGTGQLEDHELWLSLLDAGYRFKYAPVIAWHYRRSAESRSMRG